MRQQVGITATDALLAVTTLSFDIAGLELFLPLIAGAKVILADRETTLDGYPVKRTLSTGDVTMMQATPASGGSCLHPIGVRPPDYEHYAAAKPCRPIWPRSC